MMRKIAYAISALYVSVPVVAFAAAPRNFTELVYQLVTLINAAVLTLVMLGLVVFLWGIATSIKDAQEKGGERLRTWVMWGVLILFVMVSIWGILEILKNTFLDSSEFDGGTSTSIYNDSDFNGPTFPL